MQKLNKNMNMGEMMVVNAINNTSTEHMYNDDIGIDIKKRIVLKLLVSRNEIVFGEIDIIGDCESGDYDVYNIEYNNLPNCLKWIQ